MIGARCSIKILLRDGVKYFRLFPEVILSDSHKCIIYNLELLISSQIFVETNFFLILREIFKKKV